MEIPHSVESKTRDARELLDLLKAGSPKAVIHRPILLTLNIPDIPREKLSDEEKDVLFENIRVVGDQAAETFAGIEGLRVHNLMGHIGMAAVSGTCEALLKCIESQSVKSAVLGDRQVFRGATRRVSEERKDKGPPQVGG